ncbi:MAG: sigma 54-interacting transcriptional regulator, partial [Polyangia bacterium]
MVTVNKVGRSTLAGHEWVAGRYRRLRRLGEGGNGEIILVDDMTAGDRAVLKLVSTEAPSARLGLEFLRLTELAHPNIVRVRDAGIVADEGHPRAFMVMDYVAGPPLAEVLARSSGEARAVAFLAASRALADALAYLHGRGVWHGDISPANVRCDESGRPILLDFGLAGNEMPAPSATASGTLGFMAPEALVGERGPSADLFSLGATLYHAWTGSAPFGVGLDSARLVWQGKPAPPSSLRSGLPQPWDAIIVRLLAANSENRPASARELLGEMGRASARDPAPIEIDLTAPYPAGDPLAGIVVGRASEEKALRGHLERVAEGVAQVSVIWVAGPVGSGRNTIIQRALRDARLAMLVESLPAFTIEQADSVAMRRELANRQTSASSAGSEPVGRSQADVAELVAGLEERAAQQPLCLALAGSPEDKALAEAVMSSPPSGRLLLLLPCAEAKERLGSAVVELAPLTRAAIAELARRGAGAEPSHEVLELMTSSSHGLAGAVAVLARSWIKNVREGRPDSLESAEAAGDLAALLDRSFATLDLAARSTIAGVVLDAPACCTGQGEQAARAAGWLLPDRAVLPGPLHLQAFWRAVTCDRWLQDVVRRAAAGLSAADPRWAHIHGALGEHAEEAEILWASLRLARSEGAWSKVAELGRRAMASDPRQGSIPDRIALAEALGVVGRYDEALAVLETCAAATGTLTVLVVERQAWLLGRQGKPGAALARIQEVISDLPPSSDDAHMLRARIARLLISAGQFAEAFLAAQPSLQEQSMATLPAREAATLALAYSGKLDEARHLLDGMIGQVREPLATARLTSLDGLVHQLAGHAGQAASAYRLSSAAYAKAHDAHGGATATFNLGCALAELGDYGEAIAALERAVRDLGRLGAAPDQVLALFNVGQLFLQLGDLDAAGRSLQRLAAACEGAGGSYHGYACLLDAELARRRGDLPAAYDSYGRANALLAQAGMTTLAATALLSQAEVMAEMGELAKAEGLLAEVESRVAQCDSTLREPIWATRARLALATGPASGQSIVQELAIAEGLAAVSHSAREVGRVPAAWRLASLAARLFARANDERKGAERERARTLFAEVMMKTPAKYWPSLRADRDAPELGERETAGAGAAMAARMALLEARLRRSQHINKRLNSDLRLARVLETVIDTVIELTDAERGFLLLKDGAGDLVVKVARNIDQTSLEGPALSLSRSIANQAAQSGQPVVTVDAAGDTRFSELLSVSGLHLRSVLAVPLAVKGQVVGTIYVDHRLRKGVFGEDELALVLDFAEQGAIAIENARVLSELRRREQQVLSLNRRLEHELRIKEAALDDVRVELRESREAAALRYDYREIVGQSPGMLEVFRLLDRVTDTNLPVVIEGESGTGKELVARAIHFHGPRKASAFVSESCAAIPETLLESTLFGHVRGAFTGADRDARGLFAVASGGTLFLDEVAEMSPAMQGKLLRVLQNGEYHRLGSERIERCDVRIVVATNRRLAQMVDEGKFRKDLFYRLNVVRILLPSLRDRRDDIPLLLQHFLRRAALASHSACKTVAPAALAKLCSYSWPGNVRELENEVARAEAFSGSSIGVSDLSPGIQTEDIAVGAGCDSDNLTLRSRVERLERQLI